MVQAFEYGHCPESLKEAALEEVPKEISLVMNDGPTYYTYISGSLYKLSSEEDDKVTIEATKSDLSTTVSMDDLSDKFISSEVPL